MMTLGELIDTLAYFPADMPVKYETDVRPGEFMSWRGVYAELTLVPGGGPMTVGRLLLAAEAADGGTFEGYKGGDFTMSRSTPVWGDDWGECPGWALHGMKVDGQMLVLTLSKESV
jgi:hypothetical protein